MRSLLLATLIALAFPVIVSAQALGTQTPVTAASTFSISLSPQYPAPYSTVSLSLSSSSLTLSAATMVVYLNGKQFYSGPVSIISIPVKGAGSVDSLRVVVTSAGVSRTQTAIIQPQDVTLIVEPNATAPALYPGKPLVPLNGTARIVAVANIRDAAGKIISPSKLSYTWKVENATQINASGVGRDAITVDSPMQYRETTVSVSVTNQSGSLVGGASIRLNPSKPTVRIYQDDPLLGIRFNNALSSTFTMTGAETSFYAAVFSQPLSSTGGSWYVNGNEAQTGNTITLRSTGSGQGNASLMFEATSGIGAQVQATLPLLFGSSQSANSLGL